MHNLLLEKLRNAFKKRKKNFNMMAQSKHKNRKIKILFQCFKINNVVVAMRNSKSYHQCVASLSEYNTV